MQVSETVPYIGATTVQNQGYDGTGVKVAVLDSGIDYTHARFGGGGTVGAFNAAYFDNVNRDGLFPTSKVVGGYDFVGEEWPGGPIAPDDDPIDGEGHGTAVADIINSVAPGISLYAIRVCGRLSLSCNGMAMLQGLEWAFDNGMDVVNLVRPEYVAFTLSICILIFSFSGRCSLSGRRTASHLIMTCPKLSMLLASLVC
jgi:subtilisin family serine protease